MRTQTALCHLCSTMPPAPRILPRRNVHRPINLWDKGNRCYVHLQSQLAAVKPKDTVSKITSLSVLLKFPIWIYLLTLISLCLQLLGDQICLSSSKGHCNWHLGPVNYSFLGTYSRCAISVVTENWDWARLLSNASMEDRHLCYVSAPGQGSFLSAPKPDLARYYRTNILCHSGKWSITTILIAQSYML